MNKLFLAMEYFYILLDDDDEGSTVKVKKRNAVKPLLP